MSDIKPNSPVREMLLNVLNRPVAGAMVITVELNGTLSVAWRDMNDSILLGIPLQLTRLFIKRLDELNTHPPQKPMGDA